MSPIREQTKESNVSQTTRTQEMVAVLGTGTMGHAMAESALRAHIPATVWDLSPERSRDLAGLGAQVADTAIEAVGRAGIVVTMVPDADAVISIATDQGMLDALAPDSIWLQMSTIGLAGIDRVADVVESRRHDVTLLDAPVSGSKEPAEHGELTIFASGPEHARSRVQPLFDALGQQTVWMGALGAGSRMKLVNNTLLAFKAEGLASAVAVAHQLGLDTTSVSDALSGGPLLSPWDTAKLQRMGKDDYSAQFALSLALKDVHLALENVDASRLEAFGSLAHEWERAVDHGLGNEDITAVTRALEGDDG
jgi:3-hydroxyisobutyrate dehydrogenase